MSKVSVIIPVYNADKYIEKCVNSVVNQSYTNIEIILVNDGSQDNSLDLCKRLCYDHQNVICINQINSGPSSARNAGIEAATGEYLQFVDADDYIDSDMTQQLIDRIQDDNTDLVICGYRNIYLDDDIQVKKINNNIGIFGVLTQKELAKFFYELYSNLFVNSPCNKLYKSKLLHKNRIRYNESFSLGEDLLFNLDYLKCCSSISIESSCYYNYIHRNNETLTNKYFVDRYEIQSLLFNSIRNFLKYNNEYNKNNMKYIEHLYVKIVLSTISELYSVQCDLNPQEVYLKLTKIVNCEQLINALPFYKSTNLKNKILFLLVKYKQIFLLNFCYKVKSIIIY